MVHAALLATGLHPSAAKLAEAIVAVSGGIVNSDEGSIEPELLEDIKVVFCGALSPLHVGSAMSPRCSIVPNTKL